MARKRPHEEHVNAEAWAIPYADLMTLLLAFFVVMYALSTVNEGKYRAMADAMSTAFGGTPRAVSPIQPGEHPVRSQSGGRPTPIKLKPRYRCPSASVWCPHRRVNWLLRCVINSSWPARSDRWTQWHNSSSRRCH